jgi:hypothetical protein
MNDLPGAPQSILTVARQLPPAIQELHRAVLRDFCFNGNAHRDGLRQTATTLGLDIEDALQQLATADLVHTAPDGSIRVVYPFSALPTGHTVQLTGYSQAAAMCAIDALGIPLMTGHDGVVDSTDPATGAPIRIEHRGGEWTWQPATCVVVIGHTDCRGILADSVCGSITFHTDCETAQCHLDNHPEITGRIADQAEAIALADCAFDSWPLV